MAPGSELVAHDLVLNSMDRALYKLPTKNHPTRGNI